MKTNVAEIVLPHKLKHSRSVTGKRYSHVFFFFDRKKTGFMMCVTVLEADLNSFNLRPLTIS